MAKVLVADDAPSVLYSLNEFFKRKGFEVDTAHNGIEFKNKLDRNNYHLVILDIKMGEKDRSKILENSIGKGRRFPIIICQGSEDFKKNIDTFTGNNLDIEFIDKPTDLELLWNKVVNLLKKNAIREETGEEALGPKA